MEEENFGIDEWKKGKNRKPWDELLGYRHPG